MINSILNSETIRIILTVIPILGIILMSIYSWMGRKKIRKLQKYYANVKSADFQLSTNDGPNPCENDAEIDACEICGMDMSIFINEKGDV